MKEAGEDFAGVQEGDRDQGEMGSSGARRWRRAGVRGTDAEVQERARGEGCWG